MSAIFRQSVLASSLRVAAAFVGPLDSYTANGWAAWSMEKLLIGAYAGGPLLRVRRSSDSTEMDIGHEATGSYLLDTTALLAFAGAGDAFVTKRYDQFGLGNHDAQSTTTKQPRIVSAGSLDGFIRFDGTDDYMQAVNNSGTPGAVSVFIKRTLRSVGATQIMAELGTNTGSVSAEKGAAFYAGGSGGNRPSSVLFSGTTAGSSGTTYNGNEWTNNSAATVYGAVFDKSAATQPLKGRLWEGGAEKTPPTSTFASGTPSGAFSALKWNSGARNGASLIAAMNWFSQVIYEASKVSDAAAISAALA